MSVVVPSQHAGIWLDQYYISPENRRYAAPGFLLVWHQDAPDRLTIAGFVEATQVYTDLPRLLGRPLTVEEANELYTRSDELVG